MECRERPVYRGFGCFATLLYLCMCVRDTVCGVERVRDACGVCQKMGHHSKRGSDGVGVVYVSY